MSSMKKNFEKHRHFLNALAEDSSRKQRKALLDTASRAQILALAEIATNFLAGHFGINRDRIKFLDRHRHFVRRLGFKEKICWKKRKEAALALGRTLVAFLSLLLPQLVL